MAVSFRAAGAFTQNAGSGNIASVGLPAGHTTNDILLLVCSAADNVVCTVSGYTSVFEANNGANQRISVFSKVDGGSESAPTVTHAAGNSAGAFLLAFSGCRTTTPVATVGTANNESWTGATHTSTALSITPVYTNSGIIMVCGEAGSGTGGTGSNNFASWSGSGPALTETCDGYAFNGAREALIGSAWGLDTDGAAIGDRTVALSGLDGGASTSISLLLELADASPLSGGVIALGDPLLFNEVSGPGVDYGPYAFIEDRGITAPAPQTFLQDVTATTVAVTASMLKQVGKLVTSTAVGVTASMLKQVNKIMSSTAVAVTASFVKQVNKFLTATTVVVTASLGTIKVKLVTMTATTVVVTASMVRQVGKLLTATSVAVTASVVKQVNKTLTSTAVAVTASLSTIKVKLVAMTATAVVVTASMVRRVNTTLSATVATSASIVKAITHRLTATEVSVTASMVAQFGVVAQFFLKAFDAILGHPQVRDDPQDADYTSDPKGKMGSNPQQGGFD